MPTQRRATFAQHSLSMTTGMLLWSWVVVSSSRRIPNVIFTLLSPVQPNSSFVKVSSFRTLALAREVGLWLQINRVSSVLPRCTRAPYSSVPARTLLSMVVGVPFLGKSGWETECIMCRL